MPLYIVCEDCISTMFSILTQNREYGENYGNSQPQQSGSMADNDPPPLGFDTITKSDYRSPTPFQFDFSRLSGQHDPNQPYPAPSASQGYNQGAYGPPGGPAPGPVSMPVPFGDSGYQAMPAAGGYGYQPMPGYPAAPGQPSYQNFPNPAYDVGYQPNYTYGQPQPGGYQTNQYYNPQYQQPVPQPGYGAPPGPYQPPQGNYGFQGSMAPPPGQYPSQQPQYPYGQGEALQSAQNTSMLSAEPVSNYKMVT